MINEQIELYKLAIQRVKQIGLEGNNMSQFIMLTGANGVGAIHVAVSAIAFFYDDGSGGSCIQLTGSVLYVKETPERIIQLINPQPLPVLAPPPSTPTLPPHPIS